jgi:hypothetical protein
MKHKHEKYIKLKADGVLIQRKVLSSGWVEADWCFFDLTDAEFRIAPHQPSDEEGWIPWFGGENPAVGKRVDYKCITAKYSNTPSEMLSWSDKASDGDITHYRIVKEKVKKWRWMFFYPAPIQPSSIYVSEPFTEDEAAKYFAGSVRQRVVPEWKMEVECDE